MYIILCGTGWCSMTKKCYEKLLLSLYMLFIFFCGCLILHLVSSNVKNDLFSNNITISFGVVSIVFPILYFIVVLIEIFNSIRNRSKHKNITKNTNQISKFVHIPVQSHVKSSYKYPIVAEIQKIISNLSELETDSDLDKNMFVKFHVLKEQFDVDYQNTMKILTKLEAIKQSDETHLTVFKHYLNLFQAEQQKIYDNIKRQYNDELNIINEKIHHFNDL